MECRQLVVGAILKGYFGFSRALQRVKVCRSRSLRAKLTKQLGRFIRKSTCNFAIIIDMDFLLELFSGRLFLAAIQSRGCNYV